MVYSKPSYINVEPELRIKGANGVGEEIEEGVKCKELSICTVLSRCLGPVERWESVLAPLSQ